MNTRILVIRLTALGDVVLVEPVIRALQSRFPGCSIDLLTEARFAPLGRDFFGVERILGWDRHGEERGLAGIKRVIERIGSEPYLAVVDLQNKPRTRLLAARIRAEHRLVLRKRTLAQGLMSIVGRERPIADRHTIDLYLSALEPLGVDRKSAPDPLAPRAGMKAPSLARGKARAIVGLAPGATHATKRWPVDRFAALADGIHDAVEGVETVLVGGPTDRELLEAVKRRCLRARVRSEDVAGLDVRGLAGVVASLDLLVSVDTGPAHLAAALGVPVVVIFGPTSPVRWGPHGGAHRVVSMSLACAPCSNIGGAVCPLPTRSHECMEGLAVERVLEAALSALSRGEARP